MERRRRVLEIATRLFVEQGFVATSLELIARRAGVAKRTLYSDYGGKGGIFHQVIIERTLLGGIAEFTTRSEESARVTLLRAAEAVIKMCLSRDTVTLTRMIIAEVQRFPKLMSSLVSDGNANLLTDVERLLRTMAAEGRLAKQSDWRLLAKIFVDLIVGNSVLHASAGVLSTIPDSAEIILKVDLFLRAIEG
jgi:AcrR family transcriptional regulator